MERYGSDKPDVRFGMELVDLDRSVRGHRVPGVRGRRGGEGHPRRRARATCARSKLDALDRPGQVARRGRVWCGCGCATAACSSRRSPSSSPRPSSSAIVDALGARRRRPRADRRRASARWSRSVLGQLRLDLGRPPVTEGGLRFLWVVDFPLFEGVDDDGRPIPAHHPFTMPHPDDIDRLESRPAARCASQAYDLVLNGWELGSGSVRIHRPDMQQRIFSLLGIDADEAQAALRLPARRVPVRRAAARGLRVRHRPPRRDPRGRGEHPRGDRVPEDAVAAPTRSPNAPDRIDPNQLRELGLTPQPCAQRPAVRRRRSLRMSELGARTCSPRRSRSGSRARAPLAARLRPRTLDEVVGQQHLLGPGRPLRVLIESDRLSSVVLWGPPGTGKTTHRPARRRRHRARRSSRCRRSPRA